MLYRILADVVLILHFAFVVFALLGAFGVLKWRRLIAFHLLAVLWAAVVMFTGWLCPLTPLEHWLRLKAGVAVDKLGFVEQYLTPLLYPTPLTRELQITLGALVLLVNGVIYAWVLLRISRSGNRRGRRGKEET